MPKRKAVGAVAATMPKRKAVGAVSTTSPLAGQVAVVTGASGGIGAAIAKALHEAGAETVLCGRRMEALDIAKKTIVGGGTCICVDVANEASVEALFSKVAQEHGPCALLINSAGVADGGPTVEISAKTFRKVLDTNVVGSFLCAREAFKQMKAAGGGRIINLGSIAAASPRPDAVAYTASKSAVDGLTRSLSLDGRPHNIAVGVVHPGNVRSDIMSKEEADRREKVEGLMRPEDVAASVLMMATLPLAANVLEMTVLPSRQPLVGRG
jgi:NADP-dependent 3-hydroxy acid dehydrogenase YdfG